MFNAGQFQDRRQHILDRHELIYHSAFLKLLREMDDCRHADPAFRGELFIHPVTSAAGPGPVRAVPGIGITVAQVFQTVVAALLNPLRQRIPADIQVRSFGAVVGHEENKRIFKLPRRFQVFNDFTGIPVHVVNHRGKNFHLSRFKLFLIIRQILPGRFCLQPVERYRILFNQPQFLQVFKAPALQYVPSRIVPAGIVLDRFLRRLQGPVRGGKRKIGKKRPSILIITIKVLDQLAGIKAARIKVIRKPGRFTVFPVD